MSSKAKIRKLYEDLIQLPFPEATKKSHVSDWISELAEMDGFYIGLAMSLLEGKKVKTKNFPSFDTLFTALEELKSRSEISKERLKEYENYLINLERLAETIKVFIDKKQKNKNKDNNDQNKS